MTTTVSGRWLRSWTIIIILTIHLSTLFTRALPVENEVERIPDVDELERSSAGDDVEKEEETIDDGFQRARTTCTLAAAKAGKNGCRLCCPSENNILADCVCPVDGCRAREEVVGGSSSSSDVKEEDKIPCASDLEKDNNNDKNKESAQMAEAYKRILEVLRSLVKLMTKQQQQQQAKENP